MALHDAVLEIAGDMQSVADNGTNDGAKLLLTMYAKMLRSAVKAAEGTAPNPINSLVLAGTPESAALQDRLMVDKARAELRRGGDRALRQEQSEARVVTAVGGEEDGTYVPIDPHMPVGARCLLGSQTYELRADGQLHHVE